MTVSWVVYFTMPVPVLTLLVLAIKGLTLEGAGDGIEEYLGNWTFSEILDPNLWSDAIGQCFFSLGVCMGIMTAYSAHNIENRKTLVMDEKIIALGDTFIALLGGFTIYSFLGHQCHTNKAANNTYDCATSL